jgi:SulP family sulfate permease
VIGPRPPPRGWLGEGAGAVADLGVLAPLVAALVLVNGLDAGSILVMAGVLVLVSGAAFGIPFPVQPLKALTAVAVASRVGPPVIHAAGLEIGLFLLLLSAKGIADAIARIFTKTVVRSLQLGVGVLLVIAAEKLVRDPPALFRGTPPSPWPVVLAALAFAGVLWSGHRRHYVLALALLGGGVTAAWIVAHPAIVGPSLSLPRPGLPDGASLGKAFFLLVIPQLPLTFGNAVVAVNDLAHRYFGPAAARVTASRVCLSCGVGNVASAVIGGMPMCHGAGGLTAHYRLGARTGWMNVLLGSAFVLLGLFFAPQILTFLGLLPVWALAAFLAYAGLQHAFLVNDLRGGDFALAVTGGVIGAATGNLAITTGLVLSAVWGRQVARALRRSSAHTGGPTVAD